MQHDAWRQWWIERACEDRAAQSAELRDERADAVVASNLDGVDGHRERVSFFRTFDIDGACQRVHVWQRDYLRDVVVRRGNPIFECVRRLHDEGFARRHGSDGLLIRPNHIGEVAGVVDYGLHSGFHPHS